MESSSSPFPSPSPLSIYFLVSLTTIPEKFHSLEEPLQSICRQKDVMQDNITIVVNLAKEYDFRLNHSVIDATQLEAMRAQFPNVIFNEGQPDVGPGLKLVGLRSFLDSPKGQDILLQQKQKKIPVVVVLIDDDVGYFDNCLKTIADHLQQQPSMRAGSFYCYSVPIPAAAQEQQMMVVGQGVDAFFMYLDDILCYDFFGYFDRLWEYADKKVFFHDDIYISYFFYKHHIALHQIRLPDNSYVYFYTRFAAHRINALHDIIESETTRSHLQAWIPAHISSII